MDRSPRAGDKRLADDGRTREEHVKKIRSPRRDWPLWPLLPLKRNVAAGAPGYPREVGTIVAGEHEQPVVYLVNAYRFKPKDLERYKTLNYASPEALVDDGWMVD